MVSRARRFLYISVLGVALIVGCRAPSAASVQTVPHVDITARLHTEGRGESLREHVSVTRKGRRVDATVLIAPVTARASLAGLAGRFVLKLTAAPVFNVGDGMQMDLTLSDAGVSQPVYSRYFDAGRKAADRAWIPIEVPLALSGSGDVYLVIKVSGGLQGDLVADWLAFAEVVMVRAGDSQ